MLVIAFAGRRTASTLAIVVARRRQEVLFVLRRRLSTPELDHRCDLFFRH